MVDSKTKKQIEKLKKEINEHNKAYYVDNNPTISDFEYDLLMKQLIELEKKYPELLTPDSPSQKVGGEVLDKFNTITHKIPMKSLGNTYNEDDLNEFDNKVKKDVGNNIEYCVEPKIDGVSISITYENGILIQAVTRGDGTKGDDVTNNIKTIKELPLKINNQTNIELRGEVYIKISDFRSLNDEKEKKGEKTFANPRNFTSGSLKTLDSKEVSKRPLRIFLYYIANIEDEKLIKKLDTHYKRIEFIRQLNLPVVEHIKLCSDIDCVHKHIEYFAQIKETLDYETDGMVIKVNSISKQNELGYTSKESKWAIAYKYPAKQITSVIEDIVYQVGRLGSITPVAKLKPVLLSGSTVSSASLHNFEELERKDVRIGDTVFIEKAGEIIPQVIKVVIEKRPDNTEKIIQPKKCPVCNTELIKDEGEVALRCPNYDCPEQKVLRIVYYASKEGMNIEGFGEKYVRKFIDAGLLNDISDIYLLKDKISIIENMEGFGKKSADKLIQSIDKSKNNPFRQFIKALGIRYIGGKAAEILSTKYKDIDSLMNASIEELENIYDVGNTMAKSVYEYFRIDSNIDIINNLKLQNVNMKSENLEKAVNENITGKKFVLTGTLPTLTREEAKNIILKYGGEVTSAVSKKTDYILAGSNPGSKFNKAQKLNLKIISEEVFLEFIS